MISTKDMYYRKALPLSYDSRKRDKATAVKYIVIHNTGNNNDNAKNNVDYFASWNEREAGAHFFVDQNGLIGRSIPMDLSAYAVEGPGKGNLYGVVKNINSVSIELCDIVKKDPSAKMIKSVVELIAFIQKYCPNAKTIVRHYDITTKNCPERMMDCDKWGDFLNKIGYVLIGVKK